MRELAAPKVMQAKKRDAQDRVLALISRGHSVAAAMRAVARTPKTFYEWMKEPWFAERANTLRGQEVRGETPFVEFRRVYFNMTTPWHQQQVIDAIEGAEPRSVTMILLPPGGGKTTCLEDFYGYRLGEDPNFRICVACESQTLGKKIISRVQHRMTTRTRFGAYVQRYGPFKAIGREENATWNKTEFMVVRKETDERDYSMEVLGAGSTIVGSQYDLIVLDDIQSLKTLSQTDKLIGWFRQDVYTRIERANSTGRIVIVGTRVGPDDFYERMLRETLIDDLVKIPAFIEHPDTGTIASYFPKVILPNGSPLGFDVSELERIRVKVGEETWSRNYMQEPVSKRSQTFTDSMIEEAKDKDRRIDVSRSLGMYRIASLDPALTGFASFKVAAYDFERLHLLDGRNEGALGRFEELYDIVDELSGIWHPVKWVIEGNAIQKGILRDDRMQDLSRKHGFLIVGNQTGSNKQDEAIGVASMAGAFRRHEIRIPWGDDEAAERFTQLCKELKSWRADVPTRLLRQDEVMALWFLYLEWQRSKGELATRVTDNLKTRGLPYRPSSYKWTQAGRKLVPA